MATSGQLWSTRKKCIPTWIKFKGKEKSHWTEFSPQGKALSCTSLGRNWFPQRALQWEAQGAMRKGSPRQTPQPVVAPRPPGRRGHSGLPQVITVLPSKGQTHRLQEKAVLGKGCWRSFRKTAVKAEGTTAVKASVLSNHPLKSVVHFFSC